MASLNSTTVMIHVQHGCQDRFIKDRLIVESELEGNEACIFCECCDFGCPECQCRWDEVEELIEKFLEDDFIFTRMKDEDITPSRERNLVYKF